MDSAQLSCALTITSAATDDSGTATVTTELTPAKWMSDKVVICVLGSAVTSMASTDSATPIVVRTTNNGVDMSHNSAEVVLRGVFVLQSVSPLIGFVRGKTPVKITFKEAFYGPVRCRFGAAAAQSAFRMDSEGKEWVCVSPAHGSGTVELSIMDEELDLHSFGLYLHTTTQPSGSESLHYCG